MTSTNNTTEDLSPYVGTWTLDPAKTSVDFSTKALWVLSVKGTVKAVSGQARINPDGSANGTLILDAGSFDTGNKKRDDHLRSADFFEVSKHPRISFTADSVRPTGFGGLEIKGVLTVRDTSEPLTVHADITAGVDNWAIVSANVEIDRSLFGLSWAKMGAGLKNQISIRAHFDRD